MKFKIKDETRIMLISSLLVLSLIGIFFMSFIDYHQGYNLFQIGNPLIDEDWILTILSLIGVIISLKYIFSLFKEKFDHKKEKRKKKLANQIKMKGTYITLISLFFLMALIAFIDFLKGKPFLDGIILNPLFYKGEDIVIMFLSLIGVVKFTINYVKIRKKINGKKKRS